MTRDTEGSRDSGRSGLGVIRAGVIAGLVASFVVAGAQGVADLALGRALLHTPGVLGLGMIGFSGEIAATSDILRFTAVHVLVFVAIGIGLSAATHARAWRWLVAGLFLVVFFGSATMAEAWDPANLALPPWSIAGVNVVALTVLGWLLRPRSVGSD
jgi:hypothetical protein